MGNSLDSQQLASALASEQFGDCTATVVGFGFVGKEYVKALRRLGVGRIRVCSRSAKPLAELAGSGIETVAGGYASLGTKPRPDELGIVGTPTADLIPAAQHLIELGFRKLLIEKPVALYSKAIEELSCLCHKHNVDVAVAYNRVAYPSALELLARATQEGGITSCRYTFTEMIKPDWPQRFATAELARWGVANSLHVMSLAHGVIGLPREVKAYCTGQGNLQWHSGGNTLVGAGLSAQGIPFSYHADWGAPDRWSVECCTRAAAYRLCPLEELRRKTTPLADWELVPLGVLDSSVKMGFAEELAALLKPAWRNRIPLYSLDQAAALTSFGETIFGYAKG